MSTITAIMGPLSEYLYTKDYWKPILTLNLHVANFSIALEDIIFGFAFGGLVSIVYEFIIGKKFKRKGKLNYFRILIFIFPGLLCFVILNIILGLNSIFASMVGCIIGAIIVYALRPDLIWDIMLSGLFTGLGTLTFYLFYTRIFANYASQTWMLSDTKMGLLIFGAPWTEIVWAFVHGLFIGPFYEFLMNYPKLQKRPNH